jgi:hypothetical protein
MTGQLPCPPQATWKGYKTRKEWAANRNALVERLKRSLGRQEEADLAAAAAANPNATQQGAAGAARRVGANALVSAASAMLSTAAGSKHTLLAGSILAKLGGKTGECCV